MSDIVNEEVVEETTLTDEELYDQEYNSAWGEEETTDEVEEVEQPDNEDTQSDEVDVVESDEDSTDEVSDNDDVSEETNEEPSNDFAEVLKWKGKEIPVTREELIVLGQKGFDAEKKWQDVASIRPYHDLIKDNGLTVEQVTALVDIVKNKSPEAVALLAQQNGIDLYNAEVNNYKPAVETKNYELDDVIAEINQDETIANQMNDYVEPLPTVVKNRLMSEPELLRGLNIDMKQGIAQKIMPEVMKQLVINPSQDFVSLYNTIGNKVFSQPETKAEVVAEKQPEMAKSTREDKKRVTVNKKTPTPEKKIADDYDASWNDDKHFNDVLNRLSGFN